MHLATQNSMSFILKALKWYGGGGLVAKPCLSLATPWTVAPQAPLSMGFSRQEYWSGVPFPPPGDLPDPGIKSLYLASPVLAGGFFTAVPPVLLGTSF